jgi:hypothetical protein
MEQAVHEREDTSVVHNSFMSLMHLLRHSRAISRLVLVWFTLAMAAAIASPVVNPQGMALVCSVAGQVKLISVDSNAWSHDGGAPTGSAMGTSHGWNCILCMGLDASATSAEAAPLFVQVAASQLARTSLTAWPAKPVRTLPARGPPALV